MITQTQLGQQRTILTSGYNDFSKGLYRYAFLKTSNEALADDLVQSTFLKTWLYLQRGGNVLIMGAFLQHVLNRLIIDEYRKHKSTSLDVLQEKGFDPISGDSDRHIDVLDGEQLMALIAKLPVLYQEVMWLRYMQELSIKEIAVITGQTNNAITVQAYRGLEKLKVLHTIQVETCAKRVREYPTQTCKSERL